MKHEPIDRVVRNALTRLTGDEAEKCPDDNKIAAYFDGRLHPGERALLESHVAACSSCREVVALSMRLVEEQATVDTLRQAPHRKVLFQIRIPVAAVGLVVVATLAGLLYFRASRYSSRVASPSQIVELRSPVPAAAKQPSAPAPPAAAPSEPPRRDQAVHRARKGDAQRVTDQVAQSQTAASEEFRQLADLPARLEQADKPGGQAVSQADADTLRMKLAFEGNAPAPQEAADLSTGKDARIMKARTVSRLAAEAPAVGGTARAEAIGDRYFTLVSGTWVDDECAAHPDAAATEYKAGSEEYAELLKAYPGLADLRPAVIFWKGHKVTLR